MAKTGLYSPSKIGYFTHCGWEVKLKKNVFFCHKILAVDVSLISCLELVKPCNVTESSN